MLSTQLRNPTNQSSPSEFNWQALGLTGLIGTTPIIPANNLTVAGDLGANTAQSSATPNYVIPTSTSGNAFPGSTILTLRDKNTGIAGILEVLQTRGNTTILSQPFVITANNQSATISDNQTKWTKGGVDTSASSGTNAVIKRVPIKASLNVGI